MACLLAEGQHGRHKHAIKIPMKSESRPNGPIARVALSLLPESVGMIQSSIIYFSGFRRRASLTHKY